MRYPTLLPDLYELTMLTAAGAGRKGPARCTPSQFLFGRSALFSNIAV